MRQDDLSIGSLAVEEEFGRESALVGDGLRDGRESEGSGFGEIVEAQDGDIRAGSQTAIATPLQESAGDHVAQREHRGRRRGAVQDEGGRFVTRVMAVVLPP